MFGFPTRELDPDLGRGPEALVDVYVPTHTLSPGDIDVASTSSAVFPDPSVRDGVKVVLTGGMALPGHLTGTVGTDRAGA